MKRIVFVDACRLPMKSVEAVNHLQAAVPANRTIVAGVMPRIRWWEEGLKHPNSQFLRPLVLAQGATRVTLTMKIISMLPAQPDDTHWLIVGKDRAYTEIEARLQKLGIDAEFMPNICMEQAIAIVGARPSIAQRMREIAQGMLEEDTHASVPIGRFASKAVTQIPELHKRELRTELFGASRFVRIAQTIGIRVDGSRITGVD